MSSVIPLLRHPLVVRTLGQTAPCRSPIHMQKILCYFLGPFVETQVRGAPRRPILGNGTIQLLFILTKIIGCGALLRFTTRETKAPKARYRNSNQFRYVRPI
jgi:hypothetical protein